MRQYFDISIAIVANFGEVVGPRIHLGINASHEYFLGVQISSAPTECIAGRTVDIALQKGVIN